MWEVESPAGSGSDDPGQDLDDLVKIRGAEGVERKLGVALNHYDILVLKDPQVV